MVESQLFCSAWCRDNGKGVVIQEELFKYFCTSKERTRTPVNFSKRESMESFPWHLHPYGRTRKLGDFPKPDSLSTDLLFKATALEVCWLLCMQGNPLNILVGQISVSMKQAFTDIGAEDGSKCSVICFSALVREFLSQHL